MIALWEPAQSLSPCHETIQQMQVPIIAGFPYCLIAVVDGLKGFPQAIQAVFPQALVQTCVVHLMRRELSLCSSKERRELAQDMKAIYGAGSIEATEERVGEIDERWEPAIPRW